MTLLVDTSVWSLALRRDAPPDLPEIEALRRALDGGDLLVTTGLILQELLQGFTPERSRHLIVQQFASLPLVQPARDDHIAAADLRTSCRRHGVQLGTIDALIAQLCVRHELILLTTDKDFVHAAAHCDLQLWAPGRHGV